MKQHSLARHPWSVGTESLTGYILRLSETNGYMSPWSVCQLAGLRQSEIRSTGIPVAKLAAISNQPFQALKRIGFTPPPDKPRWATLLGHPVLPTDLDVTTPLFCPECVSERGFIEAHWHLRLMVACPIHLCPALSVCPHCSRKVRWFRPGLLECECGNRLSNDAGSTFLHRDVALLRVLRRKVLSEREVDENPAALPVHDLNSMELHSLLTLARTLGKYRAYADGCERADDPLQVVLASSRVLSDWPTNFFTLLGDLGEKSGKASQHGAVGKQFNGIYRSLFRNRSIGDGQTDFMRSAFLEFATDRWGRGFVDRKLTISSPGARQPRFVTLAEYSARLRVQPRTAQRILRTLPAAAERVSCGKAIRIIVDAQSEVIATKAPGRLLRLRAAARTLELPVSVLRELRISGVYKVTHLPPGHPGWHERDVHAFSAKLSGIAVPLAPIQHGTTDHISISQIMNNRHLSPKAKAALIARILAGSIAVNASPDGTFGRIRLSSGDYRRFLLDLRKNSHQDFRSPTEVAALLHCDHTTISALFEQGLLKGWRTPIGLRIDHASAESFAAEYESLASHAKASRTSTRALMAKCRKAGIVLLTIAVKSRKAPQPFARRRELDRLRATA